MNTHLFGAGFYIFMLSTLKMEKTKTTSLTSNALYITFSNFPIPVS